MSYTKAKILDTDLKDGLENLIANLGTENDKRFHGKFVNRKRLSSRGNLHELTDMYRTVWVARKIVDIIPDDMCREWRYFSGDIDPEIVQRFVEEEERLELPTYFNLAHKWGRLYGTSVVVLSVDDGGKPDEPLIIDRIKPGGLKHIKVVERDRLSADVVPVSDPFDPNYGNPEFYRINETTTKIHHSRVIRFDGQVLPYEEFRRNNYFHCSVIEPIYDDILNFCTVKDGAASMVYETNVDVIKVAGLMNMLAREGGEAILRKRFGLAKLLKSFNNMTLLDSEEDFQNKTNSFAGLENLLDRFALFLSGASDTPATRMLGSAASGLNATGEGDLKNYYDRISADQKTIYKPKLDKLDKIMAKSLGLPDDLDLSFKFNSLFQMTPKEIAEIELANAQRDGAYYDMGVVNESILAKELKQNETYTNLTDDYIDELEELNNDLGTETIDPVESTDPEESEEKGKGKESATTEDPETSRGKVSQTFDAISRALKG